MTSPSRSKAWQKLASHYLNLHHNGTTIAGLFQADASRGERYQCQLDGLFFDYSKNLMTDDTLATLRELADEAGLQQAITGMYRGECINTTENRPALHVALRTPLPDADPAFNAAANETLTRMSGFVDKVHSGAWTGYSGKAIDTVINIGIGGSDLGPAMVSTALQHWRLPQMRSFFVSNLDPAHMRQTLAQANAETTLFIVASKSFGTLETLRNAAIARRWYLDEGGDEALLHRHFVAVTANTARAQEFGIAEENVFPLWDWVGGRYSLWSAIGLPIALSIGMAPFRALLAGARRADEHFRDAPFERNIPVIMGLLSVWYGGFAGATSQVVLPYSQELHLFPAFMQQLEMESLGKSVDRDGNRLLVPSGPVVWGSAGSNGQHSFHQLLHQGTHYIPADFIAIVHTHFEADAEQHRRLLASCFSQSQALMQGKSQRQAFNELLAEGMDEGAAYALAKHKVVPGNKPSNTLLLEQLDPQSLGTLIALYEHKVFVESVIWQINAFDQWGVELGKQLGEQVFTALNAESDCDRFDASTNALINRSRRHE
ncbi:MAG: glucose-6-phosphate isomerase [Gammaproteobacteria bacterium]|nr:glucose-6-phosphate isomerase [Pseudomonadales bacterium]MCP5329641.1 glucose-6-phosphate isomerase [Pseudomonadales bacterium]